MKRANCKASPELLGRFEALINARLKRSRPRQYRQLMEKGSLSAHLKQQAERVVGLMGPTVDAGADESSALEFAWPLLYPKDEEAEDQRNRSETHTPASADLLRFNYEEAAALILQASPRKGSVVVIAAALYRASADLSEKREISLDEAACWVLGCVLRYCELQAAKPEAFMKSALGFLRDGGYELEEEMWNRSLPC